MNRKKGSCSKDALLFGITLLMLDLYGCGGRFDIYSPGEIQRTVKSVEPGIYLVSYKWPYVVDNYGPNMELLLEGAEDNEKPRIWNQAMASAVPKYLEAKGIIPAECGDNGVSVIRNGETEGDGGWAEFRCN
ncbi:MAG: hypothetical protein ABW148_02350 [Sedimenticola sp.]